MKEDLNMKLKEASTDRERKNVGRLLLAATNFVRDGPSTFSSSLRMVLSRM